MWKFEQQSDRPTLSISSVCTEPSVARRTFLGRSLTGLGTLALGTMLSAAESNTPDILATSRGVVDPRHCEPRAKRVIFLCMAGGPSHLETLDYKPKLAEMHGQPMPESFTQGQPIAQLQGQQLTCLAPQHPIRAIREIGAANQYGVSRICRESPTKCVSSVRSRPNRSIMIRRTRS